MSMFIKLLRGMFIIVFYIVEKNCINFNNDKKKMFKLIVVYVCEGICNRLKTMLRKNI